MVQKLTPRQERVIDLLKSGRWVDRGEIDSTGCVANGPGLIAQLRNLLSHDAIEMRQIDYIDRDTWIWVGTVVVVRESMEWSTAQHARDQ